jgi:hypothetical protein
LILNNKNIIHSKILADLSPMQDKLRRKFHEFP